LPYNLKKLLVYKNFKTSTKSEKLKFKIIKMSEAEELCSIFECRIEKLKYYGLIAADLENSLEDVLHSMDTTNRYKYDLPIFNSNRNSEKLIEHIRSDLELKAYVDDLENTLELVRK
jgi:hypothetical protein